MPLPNTSTFELSAEEFESLLMPQLGPEVKVKKFTSKALTQPGENYGSTISAAQLIIQQGSKEYTLPVVVKQVPPSEYLCEIFDIEITFNKEVNAYKLVSPEYENIQIEKGVPYDKVLDVFPKFYGARINKHGDSSGKADHTAVLLLENLKLAGYITGDRIEGLDFKHVQMVVSQLARFHAISVGLKILKPRAFKETVLTACASCVLDGISDDEVAEKIIMCTLDDVKEIHECVPHLGRIEDVLRDDMKEKKDPLLSPPKEPFATFVHNDFWVNNMMFKYDTAGTSSDKSQSNVVPISMKFVDFQTTVYSSPVRDLIFFLYSSAADGVIENHYDDLISLYHNEFVECLGDLGCDTVQFSFQHFQNELNTEGPKEFPHILCMMKFITADKNQIPNLSDCDLDVIIQDNYGGERYKKRVKFLTEDFLKRGWL